MHFTLEEEEDEDDQNVDYASLPYYVDKIKSLTLAGLQFLEIDCQHILQHDKELYKQVEMYPTEALQMFDLVCCLIAKDNVRQDAITGVSDMQGESEVQEVGLIQVCPYNLSTTSRIRGDRIVAKIVKVPSN